MDPKTQASMPIPASIQARGFVRHEFYLVLSLLLVALALVVPKLVHGDGRSALISLLYLAGIILVALGVLLAITWLSQQEAQPALGWRGRAVQIAGHLVRFLLFGFMGLVIATTLVAQHSLRGLAGTLVPLGMGALSGCSGLYLYHRIGKARFWSGFRWFGLALLGSFVGGILGILGPEPWSVDAGILLPLFLFLILALSGRIGPPVREEPIEDRNQS